MWWNIGSILINLSLFLWKKIKEVFLTKRNSSSLYPNCTAKTFSWLRFFNLLFRSHVWTKGIGYDVSSDALNVERRIAFSFFFFFQMFYYLLLDTFDSLHKKSKEANSNTLASAKMQLKSKIVVRVSMA